MASPARSGGLSPLEMAFFTILPMEVIFIENGEIGLGSAIDPTSTAERAPRQANEICKDDDNDDE